MSNTFFVKRLTPEDHEDETFSEEFLSALSTLGSCDIGEIQRALSTDIAARLNLAELRNLNMAFEALDVDHDGIISAAEMRASLEKHLKRDELDRVVEKVVGPGGTVAYTTFMGQLLASEVADANRLLWREFKKLDTSGTGLLSRHDVSQLLERPALARIVGDRGLSLGALMDADGDGYVSFEEFKRAIGGEAKRMPVAAVVCPDECEVGQLLEYDSPSLKLWIPCKVIAVNATGAIKIDLRPEYWMKREEQLLRLRPQMR
jgi:Ca2+-binding EF-hand superfamily protein